MVPILQLTNYIYEHTNDPNTFYIKMDDDIVWTENGFSLSLYDTALRERDVVLWWSPLVINNAICSWLIKYHTQINVNANLSAQASHAIGWASPEFAINLHEVFLQILETNNSNILHMQNKFVSLSRFSINCIGYFGEDVLKLGEDFCPKGVDDEEWISAVLPSRVGKVGRVVGNSVVSHFSFFTQEEKLLNTDILDRYALLANSINIQKY